MNTDSIWKDNKTLPEMGKLIVNKNKECGKFWPESGGGMVYYSSNTCDFNVLVNGVILTTCYPNQPE